METPPRRPTIFKACRLVDTIFICEVIEDVEELFNDFHHLQRATAEGLKKQLRLRQKEPPQHIYPLVI